MIQEGRKQELEFLNNQLLEKEEREEQNKRELIDRVADFQRKISE